MSCKQCYSQRPKGKGGAEPLLILLLILAVTMQNILVSDDGVVKLCDFGSAKFSPFVDVTQPKNMSICFKWTPNWAAPEVK